MMEKQDFKHRLTKAENIFYVYIFLILIYDNIVQLLTFYKSKVI